MSEKVERRFTAADAGPVEMEQRDGEDPKIVGCGAIYYDGTPRTEYQLGPGVVERIRPGAFAAVLREGPDTMGLFNHNPDNVLGRTTAGTLRLKSTRRGLEYAITPPDTQLGRDLAENIRRGDISGSSFSFTVTKDGLKWKEEEGQEIREIVKVDRLFDVGPVTFPAYTATDAALRSLDVEAEPPVPPAEDPHVLEDAVRRERLRNVEGRFDGQSQGYEPGIYVTRRRSDGTVCIQERGGDVNWTDGEWYCIGSEVPIDSDAQQDEVAEVLAGPWASESDVADVLLADWARRGSKSKG